MRVLNPNKLPLIDYRLVKPLQGSLKDLTDTNYAKLKAVLERRGFDVPLFLWQDGSEYYLLDGHQRQRVMITENMNDNGSYLVPYILVDAVDVQDAKAKLLEITSQYGTITYEGWDAFTAELPEAELIEATHFDALPLLGQSVEDVEVEEDEPPVVDETVEPDSKPGEIYELGLHRLMCGSATSLDAVMELMTDQKADMVLTDPPYNTGMTGKKKADGSTWLSHMFNDAYTDEEFEQLIADSLTNAYEATKGEAVFYVCIDWRSVAKIKAALEKLMPVTNVIVWDKVVHGLGSDYKYTYELIVVGKKGKPEIHNRIDRDYQDIWHVQRKIGRNEDHATAKPLSLCAKPIKHASKQDDIVLDLFGGSGSTLITADMTGRRCYMMELDPKYCDVIRKRYVNHVFGDVTDWQTKTPVITG